VKVSLAPQAEQELVEGALFYAREAGTELGHAFISEFERALGLLREHPSEVRVLAVAHQRRKPGFWKGRT